MEEYWKTATDFFMKIFVNTFGLDEVWSIIPSTILAVLAPFILIMLLFGLTSTVIKSLIKKGASKTGNSKDTRKAKQK